jgi:hypothetical protein
MTLPPWLYVTVFSSDRDPQGKKLEGDFMRYLKTPYPKTVPKKELPMWSLTRFEGNYRSQAAAIDVHGIVFDVDVAPVPSLGEIERAVEGFSGFIMSSSSATRQSPRWRLGIFVSRPIPAKDYKRVALYVADRLPFAVARNSIEPARAWYAPRELEDVDYAVN